jgi:carbamoyltransferase
VYILGLACATSLHHGAALLHDGELVGAVEEERFTRRKGYGYSPPGRPDANLINDAAVELEAALPRHSIAWLLTQAGIAFDDLDAIALNGIPAKHQDTYGALERHRPPRVLKEGRYVYVPHHLAHAASTYRLSGLDRATVITIDGRGERETACAFAAEGDAVRRGLEVLVGAEGSIGGAYETVTRILGFGPFGQGSTMALAPMGTPAYDLGQLFTLESHRRARISETALSATFAALARERDAAMADAHRNLAASAQAALERSVLAFAREVLSVRPAPGPLCLAGGVALNCAMNSVLARLPDVTEVFVVPAAHDAGTAIGAALEAAAHLGAPPPRRRLRTAALGPSYDEAACAAALTRAGLTARRVDDVAGETAARVADGRIVAWFDGALEIGPRALGQRSLLADPRRAELHPRLNAMKGREAWRPFAPSILAGHEAAFFEGAFDSPYMLFTFRVRPERCAEVPAILHVDGTTRPQSVHADALPRYARVIDGFRALTGLPLVLNTSFNGAAEPIVCTPDDAIDCFRRLGADALVLGDLIHERA